MILTVHEKNPERNEIICEASCTNQRGEPVLKEKTVIKLLEGP